MARRAFWLPVVLCVLACSDDEDDHLGGVPADKELGALTPEEAASLCDANTMNLVDAQRGACVRAAQIVAGMDTGECQRISNQCLEGASLAIDCAQWNPTRLAACTATAEEYKTCLVLLAEDSRKLACGTSPTPLPGCLDLIPAECPLPQSGTTGNP